jgi:hypothetical protein
MQHFVYVLIDPRDNSVRYVGITCDPHLRFQKHGQASSGGYRGSKRARIEELQSQQLAPEFKVVETVNDRETAKRREPIWMWYYLKQGAKLVNTTIFQSPQDADLSSISEPVTYTDIGPVVYYVYTLAYPENYPIEELRGVVFYVGKGHGNRIHSHERYAKYHPSRERLNRTIRQIWEYKRHVQKSIVFESFSEEEAKLREKEYIKLHFSQYLEV